MKAQIVKSYCSVTGMCNESWKHEDLELNNDILS